MFCKYIWLYYLFQCTIRSKKCFMLGKLFGDKEVRQMEAIRFGRRSVGAREAWLRKIITFSLARSLVRWPLAPPPSFFLLPCLTDFSLFLCYVEVRSIGMTGIFHEGVRRSKMEKPMLTTISSCNGALCLPVGRFLARCQPSIFAHAFIRV